jgi:hypothetical protein
MIDRSFELRLKKRWNAPSQHLDDTYPEKEPMWVITSIFPELNDEGEVIEIIGCCTDIRYEIASTDYSCTNNYFKSAEMGREATGYPGNKSSGV